jgi:hypothetical protein
MILQKTANIPTSFATDQNSVSLGMLDIAVKRQLEKLLLGEISFGPRGQFQSIPNGDGTDPNFSHSKLVRNIRCHR